MVRSAKEGRDPVEFSITSIADPVKPTEGNDSSIGSTFLLELKEELSPEMNLYEAIYYYFRKVTLAPIRLLTLQWADQIRRLTREEIFQIALSEASDIEPQGFELGDQGLAGKELKGDDYVVWLQVDADESFEKLAIEEGEIEILNEGVFVASDRASEWLPDHLRTCKGVINFSARAIDLPVSRDKVVDNKKSELKRTEIARKSIGLIEALVSLTGTGKNIGRRDNAALRLAYFYAKAKSDWKQKIINELDKYVVSTTQRTRDTPLYDIRTLNPEAVYIEYPHGRYVENLTVFDGKQLYHKPDDLTTLQAAIFRQSRQLVITAQRAEAGDERIKEADLIMAYFSNHNITVIDLVEKSHIEGKFRSKPLPRLVRQVLSSDIKFVEVNGLPNTRVWIVGDETWINCAHPQMRDLYEILQSENVGAEGIRLAQILINLLACHFEESLNGIFEMLSEQR